MLRDLKTRQSLGKPTPALLHRLEVVKPIAQSDWFSIGVVLLLLLTVIISYHWAKRFSVSANPTEISLHLTKPLPVLVTTRPAVSATVAGQAQPQTTRAIPQKAAVDAINQQDKLIPFIHQTTEQERYQHYQDIVTLFIAGDEQEALKRMQAFLTQYPNYAMARHTLVTWLMQQGDFVAASQALDDGLKQDNHNTAYLKLKAQLFAKQGKFDMALQVLSATMPTIEDDPDYYALMAALYIKNHDPEAAVPLYRALVQLDPRNVMGWLGLGYALESANRRSEAIIAYSQAEGLPIRDPELKASLDSHIRGLE